MVFCMKAPFVIIHLRLRLNVCVPRESRFRFGMGGAEAYIPTEACTTVNGGITEGRGEEDTPLQTERCTMVNGRMGIGKGKARRLGRVAQGTKVTG
jgi:hypothetical protein